MDPVMISLGFLDITWYAFLIVLSLCLGMIIVLRNKDIKKITDKDKDLMYDYFFYLIIFAFLGARTWYVVFDFSYYAQHLIEIPQIWQGGLAIHGGLLGGVLYTYYFTKKHNIQFFTITDAIVPALMLGQIIGRYGNFVNQEAYGPPTTYDFLKSTMHLPDFIVQGMQINGVYYQPTFLYESMGNLIGLIILVLLIRYSSLKKGTATAFYLVWYGVLRTVIEQFRMDALYFGPIRIAQLTSIIMVVIGITLFVYLKKTNETK